MGWRGSAAAVLIVRLESEKKRSGGAGSAELVVRKSTRAHTRHHVIDINDIDLSGRRVESGGAI